MRRISLTAAAAFLALALVPVQTQAQGKAKGKSESKGEGKARAGKTAKAAPLLFRQTDRTVIVEYYVKGRGRGHGGALPPGLAKQLQRNGTLPPGLDLRIVAFPRELELRLPPCPPEVRRGIIGNIAVIWNSRTGLILDATAVLGL